MINTRVHIQVHAGYSKVLLSSARERAPASTFIVISFSGINKSNGLTTLMLLKQKETKILTERPKQQEAKCSEKLYGGVFEVRLSVS